MTDRDDSPKDVPFREIAPMAEFACWVAVVLCPILRLVNGPAVSTDQFVVQVAMFSLALIGGISLRTYNFFTRRRR